MPLACTGTEMQDQGDATVTRIAKWRGRRLVISETRLNQFAGATDATRVILRKSWVAEAS